MPNLFRIVISPFAMWTNHNMGKFKKQFKAQNVLFRSSDCRRTLFYQPDGVSSSIVIFTISCCWICENKRKISGLVEKRAKFNLKGPTAIFIFDKACYGFCFYFQFHLKRAEWDGENKCRAGLKSLNFIVLSLLAVAAKSNASRERAKGSMRGQEKVVGRSTTISAYRSSDGYLVSATTIWSLLCDLQKPCFERSGSALFCYLEYLPLNKRHHFYGDAENSDSFCVLCCDLQYGHFNGVLQLAAKILFFFCNFLISGIFSKYYSEILYYCRILIICCYNLTMAKLCRYRIIFDHWNFPLLRIR